MLFLRASTHLRIDKIFGSVTIEYFFLEKRRRQRNTENTERRRNIQDRINRSLNAANEANRAGMSFMFVFVPYNLRVVSDCECQFFKTAVYITCSTSGSGFRI